MFKMGSTRVSYGSHTMMITGLLSTDGEEVSQGPGGTEASVYTVGF